MNAENSRKVAAAVADLRRALPKKPPMDLERRIAKLEKTCAAVIAEFERISNDQGIGTARTLFQSALTRARAELGGGRGQRSGVEWGAMHHALKPHRYAARASPWSRDRRSAFKSI